MLALLGHLSLLFQPTSGSGSLARLHRIHARQDQGIRCRAGASEGLAAFVSCVSRRGAAPFAEGGGGHMPIERFDFPNANGLRLAAVLDRPGEEPVAFALFAHCFTCGKDNLAASRIAYALAERRIAVLRFDF